MKSGTLRRVAAVAIAASLVALIAAPVLAQAPAAPPAPTPNKGDTAWMLTASALVLLMTIPGLALFYGGLVRTKNMLSMLMQVFFIVCIVCLPHLTASQSARTRHNRCTLREKRTLASGDITEFPVGCYRSAAFCNRLLLLLASVRLELRVLDHLKALLYGRVILRIWEGYLTRRHVQVVL